MTKNAKQTRAAEIAESIRANVQDFYDNRISFDEFGRLNRGWWDRAESEGVAREVAKIVGKR